MADYGTLHESKGRYLLRFERFFPYCPEEVFMVLTNPDDFKEWYPCATGEMELKVGGVIRFDDEEGTVSEAIITELDAPHTFSFQEGDELIHITLKNHDKGCHMIFTHTFDDLSWAVNTATGWHGCLEVLEQIVNGEPISWQNDVDRLMGIYSESFDKTFR
ncbi:SRPBCC family protein [Jeotgalibaca sp. A122]|uniref:SRPBCC family protein n=1 Tax=Jeotgalibaca sp. A122 TaxID=3457322 RepID=UPI003FD09458